MRVVTCVEDLRELHAQTGETVNLSVRHDDEIVYVERTSSGRSAMRVVHVIGARAALHVTAAGKLFLLEDGFARLREYAKRTGLAAHTKNTIVNATQFERELERIQRQGWATDNEEAEIGVRCVAAGVRDDAGQLIAALSLSTPASATAARISTMGSLSLSPRMSAFSPPAPRTLPSARAAATRCSGSGAFIWSASASMASAVPRIPSASIAGNRASAFSRVRLFAMRDTWCAASCSFRRRAESVRIGRASCRERVYACV